MHLYEPTLADRFVWAAVSKNDRSNPRKVLHVTTEHDDHEKLLFNGMEPVQSTPSGRYDSLGRYMVHLPAIPGHHGGLARYALHPHANQAMADARTERLHAA